MEMIDKENGFTPANDGEFHIMQASHNIGYYDAIREIVDTAHTLYLRIHYSGTMSNFFAIDNLLVTADGMVAVDRPNTDNMGVKIMSANGLMNVCATHNIRQIEVYSIQGMRIADYKVNSGNLFTIPVPVKGVSIVRVTTEAGVKVLKVLL